MANPSLFFALLFLLIPLDIITLNIDAATDPSCSNNTIDATDEDMIEFAMNLEFLEAEFFLNGALGRGLDAFDPTLAKGGPPPTGAKKADLGPLTSRIIEEFGYQEIGHLRAIVGRVGGIQRPLLDLSPKNFAELFDKAVGQKLNPPFDPYANSLNYLLASYVIPYVGLVGYVGTIPNLAKDNSRSLVASLLGVEAGQDAVIRTLLYERGNETLVPYNMTVAKFTNDISTLRNNLGMCGIKDEGVIVPEQLGAENRTVSNVLSANTDSLSYSRNPLEILRIVYGSGNESVPGGFFPLGGNGRIAQRLLVRP